MIENPNFHLEAVVREKDALQDFEGPLSLILMLLSKNKIEIREVSISQILDQYLAYLDEMQSMDLEIASEFVQMAAHLLYIKTKTLLTAEEEVSELEVLLQSLEQLKCKGVLDAVRQVTPELKRSAEQGMLYYSKLPEPPPPSAKLYAYQHKSADLLRALFSLYARGAKTPEREDTITQAIPQRIVYSVRMKSRQLVERLSRGPASLDELYAACASRSEVVATFMSILELCSLGSVCVERREEGYFARFTGGDVEEILEKIEE